MDIFSAAHEGNQEGVRRELAAGVDPNAFAKGQSVLMIAAERGHSSICELLVRNGAKVNAADRYGRTALYQAVVFNHPRCVTALVANGAKQDTRSWLGGESPLDIAKLRSNVELQRALSAEANQKAPPEVTLSDKALALAAPPQSLHQSQPTIEPVHQPLALSYPRLPPAPETDESRRPEPLTTSTNTI